MLAALPCILSSPKKGKKKPQSALLLLIISLNLAGGILVPPKLMLKLKVSVPETGSLPAQKSPSV